MPALKLDNVSKRYGMDKPVISDFSHTFSPGTSTGLVGANGSGKTTLLRLLSVMAFPSSGEILFDNQSIHSAPHAYLAHTGIVHAESSLPQFLSATELLEYALRSRDQWNAKGPARIDEVLTALRLDERRTNLIGTYSSGMVKKTQIAMALITEPDILLMDEPFRGLDQESLEAALDRFKAVQQRGGLMVIASHRKDMLSSLCETYIDLESLINGSS